MVTNKDRKKISKIKKNITDTDQNNILKENSFPADNKESKTEQVKPLGFDAPGGGLQ